MEVIKAIEKRKSIRGFLNKEVPVDILKEIVNVALKSPSGMNIQPWKIHVVTGRTLDKIKDENEFYFIHGQSSDISEPHLKPIFKDRRKELAIDLFELLDIKREDKDKRRDWVRKGHRFFEAPAAMIFTIDNELFQDKWGIIDIGMIVQTVCLAAMEYEISTCIAEQGVAFHKVIKENLNLEESEVIMIAVYLGYEDHDAPANKLESKRASIEEITKFYD